ncbi:MAG: 16S rRNA (guanine(527)-N(7))-methyltransferase RsmG [Lactobacillus sp.]|jgi:16S rRNA (guanine527-N7)-methyltransferase|nr:16S rRNA (guanine(527)-N(7))-methyltransferase RsmG [Lactobacillus sp.]
MSPELFRQTLAQKYQINLSDQQMTQFAQYFELLVATNKQVNLTSITAVEEVYLKHFYDSITPYLYFKDLFDANPAMTVCDVGAGAGFPSIPLKIVLPQLKVTIIDSLNKRITFLKTLTETLGLSEVTLLHGRAEEYATPKSPLRASFDLVLSRAVAAMPVLAEFCLPYVKLNGYFLALKGQKGASEQAAAQFAIATLGGKVIAEKTFTLPDTDQQRDLILIEKKKVTPNKYPRKAGTPAKKPLIH